MGALLPALLTPALAFEKSSDGATLFALKLLQDKGQHMREEGGAQPFVFGGGVSGKNIDLQ